MKGKSGIILPGGPGFCPECFGGRFIRNGKRKDGRQIFKCVACGWQSVAGSAREVVTMLLDNRAREIAKGLLRAGVAVPVVAGATKIPRRTLTEYRRKLF